MRKRMLLTAMICATALLTQGCGGVRYPSYYRLSIAPPLMPHAAGTHSPMSVAVQRFETPEYLRQGRVVYCKGPNDIGFYEYHRWAVDPGTAVTTAIVESLRSERLFSSAALYQGQMSSDYLLTGRMERLDEIDYGGAVKVEAKLSAQLMNLRTGSIVWAGDAAKTSRVEGHDVNAVVTEMTHALQACIDRLLTGMEQKVLGT